MIEANSKKVGKHFYEICLLKYHVHHSDIYKQIKRKQETAVKATKETRVYRSKSTLDVLL